MAAQSRGVPAPDAAAAVPRLLEGRCIAVARDAAFAFLYPANCALLEAMGARLFFFSPLADKGLPPCDALWLPGGYPELHLNRLSANAAMIAAVRAHHGAGKPILAECGGMLYCTKAVSDTDGNRAPMAGLLPGEARMQPKLAALALQQVSMPGIGILRGHSFHYSRLDTQAPPLARATDRQGRPGEAVYRAGPLIASYVHFYFPSDPQAAAALFLPPAGQLPVSSAPVKARAAYSWHS